MNTITLSDKELLERVLSALPEGTSSPIPAEDLETGNFESGIFVLPSGVVQFELNYTGPSSSLSVSEQVPSEEALKRILMEEYEYSEKAFADLRLLSVYRIRRGFMIACFVGAQYHVAFLKPEWLTWEALGLPKHHHDQSCKLKAAKIASMIGSPLLYEREERSST